MFRITIMVHDSRLPDALRKLVGIAIGPPEVVPVVNAVEKKEKITQKTNGDMASMLVQYMRDKDMSEITGTQAKKLIAEFGGRTSSYSYYLNEAVRKKALKKLGKLNGTNTMRYARTLVREA